MKKSAIIYQVKKTFWQKRVKIFLIASFLVGLVLFFSPLFSQGISLKNSPEPQIKNFLLTIEKIGLENAPIIPEVNIDHAKEYKQALTQGLVHAKGTAFPDEGKMVYIFGHSINYPWFIQSKKALFYQIEKVAVGDRIKIEYNNQSYFYYVYDRQIVAPEEVSLIEEKLDEDILVLQSCYPPGTTWQRLLLFSHPAK